MADAVDEDTLEAVAALWRATPALTALAAAPAAGRIRGPLTPPYAQAESRFEKNELSGTGGAWHDFRRVTLTVRGAKADVVALTKAMGAVFNLQTTLTFPSGARFMRWKAANGGGSLGQEQDQAGGSDVWAARIEAEVWTVRSY